MPDLIRHPACRAAWPSRWTPGQARGDGLGWGGQRRMAFTTRRHAGLDPASSARRSIAVKMDPGGKPGVTAWGGVARGGWSSPLAVMPDLIRHRSEEHTSALDSLMRNRDAEF